METIIKKCSDYQIEFDESRLMCSWGLHSRSQGKLFGRPEEIQTYFLAYFSKDLWNFFFPDGYFKEKRIGKSFVVDNHGPISCFETGKLTITCLSKNEFGFVFDDTERVAGELQKMLEEKHPGYARSGAGFSTSPEKVAEMLGGGVKKTASGWKITGLSRPVWVVPSDQPFGMGLFPPGFFKFEIK